MVACCENRICRPSDFRVISVGIGGDFYGAEGIELVEGLEDVSKYPDLIAELIRRGWSDDDLAKLTQENVLRVFRKSEAVSVR